MNENTLFFWQPIAVAWMYSMIRGPSLSAILADALGCGKTIEFLSLFQVILNDRRTLKPRDVVIKYGRPKQFLVVVPNNPVRQWVKEIGKHTP